MTFVDKIKSEGMFGFWPFKKKKEKDPEPLGNQLKVDYHAHWLPGIDDGAKNIQDSLSMLKSFQELGYQRLVATPHIIADLYPNQSEDIKLVLESVKIAAARAGVDLELYAAAEYMLDEGFYAFLEKNDLLCIKDNLVLIEQSMLQPMPGVKEKIFALQVKGYLPVLAHPERYGFLHSKKLERYREYKDMGCLFQLNLLSLMGYYGKPVAQTAGQLLKAGYYDLAGSDAHHSKHLAKLAEFNMHIGHLGF